MKAITLSVAAAAAALVFSAPAHAADAPKFTASCPTNIAVKSNGKGRIRINGVKASVKTFNSNSWGAESKGIRIDIAKDGRELIVSYTGKGGVNGICQVTSLESGPAAGSNAAGDMNGVPPKDQQACLAAVSRKTNNGDVDILDASSSEANNTVIVGVGSQRAKWKCLVKRGQVGEVMSLTNEGAL